MSVSVSVIVHTTYKLSQYAVSALQSVGAIRSIQKVVTTQGWRYRVVLGSTILGTPLKT